MKSKQKEAAACRGISEPFHACANGDLHVPDILPLACEENDQPLLEFLGRLPLEHTSAAGLGRVLVAQAAQSSLENTVEFDRLQPQRGEHVGNS